MSEEYVRRIRSLHCTDAQREKVVSYLADRMGAFLHRRERVLICIPGRENNSLAGVFEDAVRKAGAIPMYWGPDFRWKALLRQAFSSRATAVIGQPLLLLGLMKLAKNAGTPLFIRNVLLTGYPWYHWMEDGIRQGLDCHVWGCYIPGGDTMVAGFSCPEEKGIHIWKEAFDARLVSDKGITLLPGERGRLELTARDGSGKVWDTGDLATRETLPCPCGEKGMLLRDIVPEKMPDTPFHQLMEPLLSWSSVLDFRAERTEMGLSLEVVCFPEELLPQLPTSAKLIFRYWNPDRDMPFCLQDSE